MRRVPVDVICHNDFVTPAEARHVTKVLARQIERDFAPVWNVTADLRFAGHPSRARKDAWQLALLDENDADNDGYHQLTTQGLPLGKVLLRTASQCPTGWTSTASHELLEMLVNPDTQVAVFVYDDDVGGRVYQCEVCDPCQDDPFCYRIDGVWVSDFVYPAWFDGWRKPGSTRFDHARKLRTPFKVPSGGFMTYYDARTRKWIQDGGRHGAVKLDPIYGLARRGGSRSELRMVPRPKWRKSKR
jgi:hypothetical protein